MSKSKKPIATQHPFGIKINQVMVMKGMAGDYQALADVFGVTVQSAREWVQYGRLSKAHYARLVLWSGRVLHWWFDVPAPMGKDANATIALTPAPAPWPFRHVSAGDYAQLDEYERGQVEGLVRALLIQAQGKRKAAA